MFGNFLYLFFFFNKWFFFFKYFEDFFFVLFKRGFFFIINLLKGNKFIFKWILEEAADLLMYPMMNFEYIEEIENFNQKIMDLNLSVNKLKLIKIKKF